jgi:hypothetical protein
LPIRCWDEREPILRSGGLKRRLYLRHHDLAEKLVNSLRRGRQAAAD